LRVAAELVNLTQMEPFSNNSFKVPFCVVCGVGLAIFAITGHETWLTAPIAVFSLIYAWILRTGRNPRWTQSPHDRREAERRARKR
jgi:hypothetical protein